MLYLKIVVFGNSQTGKSTLIDRLFGETGRSNLNEAKIYKSPYEVPVFKNPACPGYIHKFSNLTGNLNDGIAETEFGTAERKYLLIDASSHEKLTENVLTGKINAQAAILVLDVMHGLNTHTYQQLYLLSLFGIKEVIVIINKMDLKLYNRLQFWELSEEIKEQTKKFNMEIISVIPASAGNGDNIITKSNKMKWNTSPTLKRALDYLSPPGREAQLPLRFLVQGLDVAQEKTRVIGKVAAGMIFKNQQLTFGPLYHTTKVLKIEFSTHEKTFAKAGMSVALTLEYPGKIERGQIGFNICCPPITTDYIVADVFWQSSTPLSYDDKIHVLSSTQICAGRVVTISKAVDPACIDIISRHPDQLKQFHIGKVGIKLRSPICVDPFIKISELGKFIILKNDKISGGGVLT